MRTRNKIRRFILKEVLPDRVVVGDPLAEGLLDSLAIERVVVFLEEEFGITIHDDDVTAENLDSLDALSALVESKLRSPG